MDDPTQSAREEVIFRASKEGNSEVAQMTRATAEERKAELEAEGWTVEIRELLPDPVEDDPGQDRRQ